jgi:hypothetical protein
MSSGIVRITGGLIMCRIRLEYDIDEGVCMGDLTVEDVQIDLQKIYGGCPGNSFDVPPHTASDMLDYGIPTVACNEVAHLLNVLTKNCQNCKEE